MTVKMSEVARAERVFQTAAKLHEKAYRLQIYLEAQAIRARKYGYFSEAERYDYDARQVRDIQHALAPDMTAAHEAWAAYGAQIAQDAQS